MDGAKASDIHSGSTGSTVSVEPFHSFTPFEILWIVKPDLPVLDVTTVVEQERDIGPALRDLDKGRGTLAQHLGGTWTINR